MPKMATGTRGLASSISGEAEPLRQLRGLHRRHGLAQLRTGDRRGHDSTATAAAAN